MSDNQILGWIVIVQRRPRGPLSATEIKSLIAQKILRTNDIACIAPAPGDDQKTEWKFLWQFPEFDRRLERKPKTDGYDGSDRRREPTSNEAKGSVEAVLKKVDPDQIPEELRQISATDLVLTARKIDPSAAMEKLENDEKNLRRMEQDGESSGAMMWVFGLLVIGCVGWGLTTLFKNAPSLTSSLEPEKKRETRAPIRRPAMKSINPGQLAIPRQGKIEKMEEPEIAPPPRSSRRNEGREPRETGFIDEDPRDEEDLAEAMADSLSGDSENGEEGKKSLSPLRRNSKAKKPPIAEDEEPLADTDQLDEE